MKVLLKCLVPLLALTALLSGCAQNTRTAERDVFAMDTFMHLSCTGADAEAALGECAAEIARLDKLLSVSGAESDVRALNAAGGAPVSVGADTAAVLEIAVAAAKRTGGAFDPTVYPLVEAWGFQTDAPAVPDAETIAERRALVGAEKIEIDGETVRLLDGAQIDLGGVGKGYCADRLCALLRGRGITSALLTLGGNVQAVGSRPDGSDWRIGVRDPDDPEGVVGVLTLSDAAAVTSGGYQRYFEEDGRVYHHILDPKTGAPADSGLRSVTIVSADGALADALSTALFVMGLEKSIDLWRASDDFEAVFLTADGTVYATEGADFTPSDGKDCRKISKSF